MTKEVNIYPLDVEKLNKGDLIPVKIIEQQTGVERENNLIDYNLARLSFIGKLKKACEMRGIFYKFKADKSGGIKILTSSESSEYCHKRFKGHIKGAYREHRDNMTTVDRNELSEPELAEYNKNVQNEAFLISGIKEAEKTLRLPKPTVRNTPKLTD